MTTGETTPTPQFAANAAEPSAMRTTASAPAPEEASIAIFGASGDLAARKLLPALFALWKDGYLSDRSPIVGVARRDKSDESFREEMFRAVRDHSRRGAVGAVGADEWARFAGRLFYRRLDITNAGDYAQFGRELDAIEQRAGVAGKRVVYLATAPELFLPAVGALSEAGLIPGPDDPCRLRVVFEKPYGHDLASARELTARLGRLLREEQIFRIDHYLGKETVQNILLFRFGNAIFEPLFNRNHVDHVQITVAESQGIERERGAYYDKAGAVRDVLQNHLLQLVCLASMEPPALFRAAEIRSEKLKVLQALAPGRSGGVSEWAVAGQYAAAEINGERVPGYRDEERVDPDSRRETFVAMHVSIDNWRWAGVPFFLRTGKRMRERVTEIAFEFKHPPLNLFATVECEGDLCDLVEARPNTLIFRIQPREAISLTVSTKRPGMQYQVQPVTMDFAYESRFARALPEAYERLLLDVLRGDSTLFTRSDELEAAWSFVQPVLDAWEQPDHHPEPYAAGTWGPAAADALIAGDPSAVSRSAPGGARRRWRRPTAG